MRNATPQKHGATMESLDDAVDHVRGPSAGRLIVEYGDYECPYSGQAFREIERVELQLSDGVRLAFRHFPLAEIHPHALAAAAAAEAASLQGKFWNTHDLLFHRQKALEGDHLRRYAAELELDVARFDSDRTSGGVLARIRRDVESGIKSGEVRGTPTRSSTEPCTAAATARPPCWRRSPDERDHERVERGGHFNVDASHPVDLIRRVQTRDW